MRIALFSCLALWLALASAAWGQTPFPATDRQLVPTIYAEPGVGGTLDVAWRSTDGRLMLSTFSGPSFNTGRQLQLSSTLSLLGGLARDEAGNRYIAAFRREEASAQDWDAGFRPGVANVFKAPAGSDQVSVLADINQAKFIANNRPIINPLFMANKHAINSELRYSDGMLTLAFGHNNGWVQDIHNTGALIGIGLDGSPKYNKGGQQHTFQIRLGVDGGNFVHAQTFDQGLGLATLKREGDEYKWSDFVLVYGVDQQQRHIEVAGIVPTRSSYLVFFSTGGGHLMQWDGMAHEIGANGNCSIQVMRVARDFDRLPKFDWFANVRDPQGNFPVTTIAAPRESNKSYLRPILVPLPDGRTIVAFEQWGPPHRQAEGVRAVMLDSNGDVQAQSELFEGYQIQKSTRGIYLPTLGRMGWVNGEDGRLVLHTIDSNLKLTSFELGRDSNPPRPQIPAGLTSAELAGEYKWDTGVSVRIGAVRDNLKWILFGQEYLMLRDRDRPNTFNIPDMNTTVTFNNKNELVHEGQTLKRVGSTPPPVPTPQPAPQPIPQPIPQPTPQPTPQPAPQPTPGPTPAPQPSGLPTADLAGDWTNATGSFKFTLRAAGDGLTWVDSTGTFNLAKNGRLVDSYVFPGTTTIIIFANKDEATFHVQGNQPVTLRRQVAQPAPGPNPAPNPAPNPGPNPGPATITAADVEGDWTNSAGSFLFNLRANGEGLTWRDATGVYELERLGTPPNTYRFRGSQTLVSFISKDAASFIQVGKPNGELRRRAQAPQPVVLTEQQLIGRYVRPNPENDYHEGVIELIEMPGGRPILRWRNRAGVSWTLFPRLENNILMTDRENPYFTTDPTNGREFIIVQAKNADGSPKAEVEGFSFMDEIYRRVR